MEKQPSIPVFQLFTGMLVVFLIGFHIVDRNWMIIDRHNREISIIELELGSFCPRENPPGNDSLPPLHHVAPNA
jgi:hypothetical protein